ncbi:MAG: DUF1302 family protein [Proteobacteria bacterium]|nr:DUF1302 family protein [Pseudomonadota bacterium]
MKKKLLAASVLAVVSTQASAFRFDAGDDFEIRWDNTLKYNLMLRAEDPHKDVLGTLATADPTLGVEKGDIISNRFDILSEMDVVWKDTFGFRISGAAWYDVALSNGMDQPNSIAPHWTNPSVPVGELNSEAKSNHYMGAEILDAFIFANFDIGDMAGNVRLGRHSIYWGQSLLLTGAVHSVGGSMNTIDGIKGFAVPGSEAKELFRPTNKISTVFQFTDNLTMEAYYSLEWENYRLPEATTFFSPSDALTEDAEMIHLALAPAFPGFEGPVGIGLEMQDDEYSDDGEWGINFSYFFDASGLEISAYYLNYNSKVTDGLTGVIDGKQALTVGFFDELIVGTGVPESVLPGLKAAFGAAPDLVSAELGQVSIGKAKWMYKEDIDLYGISFSKEYAGISFGMDITHRRNTPLRVDSATALQQFDNYPDFPPLEEGLTAVFGPEYDFDGADGASYDRSPVGNTYHLVFNGLGFLQDNGIWQGGTYLFEASFAYLDEVKTNEHMLLNTPGAVSIEEGDTSAHLSLIFAPVWYQVLPGVDLTMRTSVGMGLTGSAPLGLGGDEEVGNGSFGLSANVDQLWTADVRYNFFFGPQKNGIGGNWKDRDNVSFTIKRTF